MPSNRNRNTKVQWMLFSSGSKASGSTRKTRGYNHHECSIAVCVLKWCNRITQAKPSGNYILSQWMAMNIRKSSGVGCVRLVIKKCAEIIWLEKLASERQTRKGIKPINSFLLERSPFFSRTFGFFLPNQRTELLIQCSFRIFCFWSWTLEFQCIGNLVGNYFIV